MHQMLQERTAMVLGAGSPTGAAVTSALEREGCKVFPYNAPAGGQGRTPQFGPAEEAVQSTIERFGRLDCLVCCGLEQAGTGRSSEDLTPAEWEAGLDVLRSVAGAAHAAALAMAERKTGGAIVLVASRTSFAGDGPARAAAGAAAMGLTAAMTAALAPHSIAVNCVLASQDGDRSTAGLDALVAFLCSEQGAELRGRYISIEGDRVMALSKPLVTGAWSAMLRSDEAWTPEAIASGLPPLIRAMPE
jgi:NAD(P)-dependent dehydrogenase (short-subunit alcohol dehydrogenase family)